MLRILVYAFVLLTACSEPRGGDEAAIRDVVKRYLESVEAADTGMARKVWAADERISFIHPMGHERGWEQIKSNVYEKLMGGLFSKRRLAARDVAVKVYGDFAVVEFYWVFDATWKKDGSALQTRGRETQVMRRGKGGAWELVHVHYSGMPPENGRPAL